MTCNRHHDTDDIQAALGRICDQFREGLLGTMASLYDSGQAPPINEEAEETRRTIEKIKAKEFISVEEAALLFGCSEQHLRNQVQKAIDGAAVHPIPFADLEGVVRFPLVQLLEWVPIPKPRAGGKAKRRKKHGTHLSVAGK
ncbi:MAG: helix-turn-helix domain-containing protein [Pyrinomonadaceae bacterium]